jgi:amino acid transporter
MNQILHRRNPEASSPGTIRKLRLLPLAAVIFFTVSGGPYGLEPVLAYAGKNAAFFLLLLAPLIWDIPSILTVMELNGMMPVTGGYYQWVKRALGMRWAFYEGWWTWLYTFTDLAIYPVLFVEYAGFFFPSLLPYKVPVCLLVIWTGAGLNIRGIVSVGQISMILTAIVLIPFLLLVGISFFHHAGHLAIPSPSLQGVAFPSLAMALYTILWNYIGWDNATTYAGEVHRPARTYLASTAIAFCSIYLLYLLATFAAAQSGIDFNYLSEKGFPVLALKEGGKWLAVLLAIGGMASTLGIFCAVLLSVTRVPEVMAEDHLLPRKLQTIHPAYGTPYISILVCALIVSAMIFWSFADLVIIDVSLYGMGLLLEFISLIVLRIRFPTEPRPFKIRLPVSGLCLLLLLPMALFAVAVTGVLAASHRTPGPLVFTFFALVSAEVLWWIIQAFRGRKKLVS